MTRSRLGNAPRITFSVGVPFSGSTAFGNFINALSPNTYIGEIDRMPQNLPYYGGHAGQAFCHRCRLAGETCPYWNDEQVTELSTLSTTDLYTRLLGRTKHHSLIDGSKNPGYMHRVAPEFNADWDTRVVVLTRNPLHSMASFMGSESVRGVTVEPWQAANFWRDNYAHITSVVGSFGLPVVYFPTEILRSKDPAELSARTLVVRRFVGLDGIPMPTSAAGIEAMFQVTHQYGGNGGVQNAGRVSRASAAAAAIRTERFDELADAWIQAPGAIELAKVIGIHVRAVLNAES
jgi:hypothetical protein